MAAPADKPTPRAGTAYGCQGGFFNAKGVKIPVAVTVRAAAAEALLNRGWGSPTQHVEMDMREQPPLLPYTDEELLARLQAHVDEKRVRAKRMH